MEYSFICNNCKEEFKSTKNNAVCKKCKTDILFNMYKCDSCKEIFALNHKVNIMCTKCGCKILYKQRSKNVPLIEIQK